jgi:hypothetical protein
MMKHTRNTLIVAILFLATSANAGTWAVANNKSGGTIGLTDEACPTGGGKFMFSNSTKGQTHYGCWYYSKGDDFVHVRYFDNTFYTYPLSAFTMTDYATKGEKVDDASRL